MGIIAGVAAALASVVGSVVATVGVLVASAVTAVTIAVSSVIATVTSVISSIVSSITSAFAGEVLHTTVMVDGIAIPIEIASQSVFVSLSVWIEAIKTSFSAFLTAIYFDTFVVIHEIAYLTSSSYRNMMAKVYGKLGEFSEAIGRATGFIETAIQIARKTSLGVSSFLGKRYDIAEVVWLQDFRVLLDRINDTSAVYAENPSQIWNDLDELIIRPAIDTKAEAQITMFATVRNALDMVKQIDVTLDGVQKHFTDSLNELPAKWRNDLLPFVDKVTDNIQGWRESIYNPTIRTIDKVMEVFDSRTAKAKRDLEIVEARLARGGDILAAIDELSELERLEQEYKIAEVSTRVLRRGHNYWIRELEKHDMPLEDIRAAVELALEKELSIKAAHTILTVPVGKEAKSKKTWFVEE